VLPTNLSADACVLLGLALPVVLSLGCVVFFISCPKADETNLPSLWYTLTTEDMTKEEEFQYGDLGYFVQVSNFTDSHRLAVFVGDSCSDNLACIANATGEGSSGALLLWDRLSEDSETYYIVLQSYEDFGASQFEITWGDWGSNASRA